MRTNYIEVLSNKVEIPIIQRDYAQGRMDSKVQKIRKDFLDVLFDFIRNKNQSNSSSEIELDFIYGFTESDTPNQSTFIPIDGQQRLTTLWLIYWYISVIEKVPDDEKQFLSNFLYEIRHSTTEFCKQLLKFKPKFSHDHISKEIKNQAWYFETWDYDPSIQAMLIVLDDIHERYRSLNSNSIWKILEGQQCPFYFYKLDMNKVGLTDDLYIKMNSRGKGLTEFEYFKAGFSELLRHPERKARFEKKIDGEWMDMVWQIIYESNPAPEDDIALIADDAFLNLFNFITSAISFKKDIKSPNGFRYIDTVSSADLLKVIYSDSENQEFLLETLDAICKQQETNPSFWTDLFYCEKDEFEISKTRLFFQHKEVNLFKHCLFHFAENRGLSYSEQLLLFACFSQFKTPSNNFQKHIRVIRNLVTNSDNELRDATLGLSFEEIETYLIDGDLNVLKSFKSDQIEEEKNKEEFATQFPNDIGPLRQLEDSDILRGSISILPFNNSFGRRAEKFLAIFEEGEMTRNFDAKSNLLLCFGDYSQDDGSLTNLMSPNIPIIRSFFTTPGYNKTQFFSKTRTVILSCLDYFTDNPTVSVTQKLNETLNGYSQNPKDWRYYFLKYPSFRENCTRGYYQWYNGDYCIWKMRVRQFNGYHWDPFLYEMAHSDLSDNLNLEAYGAKLLFTFNRKKILISTLPNGFLFENAMSSGVANSLMDDLITAGTISSQGELVITQNSDDVDLEDRLEKLYQVLKSVMTK